MSVVRKVKINNKICSIATKNQIYHIPFIDKMHVKTIVDVNSQHGTECNIDHYLVLAVIRAGIKNGYK